MRVLITGNRGFVGRHFERHYSVGGHEVVGLDILNGGDCRDVLDVEMNGGVGYFDLVIHCAAVVGGRAGIDGQPLHLMAEDLSIDAALFRWALRARPKRIVCFSSAAAYPIRLQGKASQMRLGEEWVGGTTTWFDTPAIGVPDASYGWSKLTLEYLADRANAEGINTHVFRPFSGYGAEQSNDYPWPTILGRTARKENPIKLWSDGVRDWVHIDDIVGAVLAAIDNDALGPVNICTGIGTSMSDLATRAGIEMGYRPTIEILDDMPTGVHYRVGDPTLLNEFYTCKVSVDEGIRRTLRAYTA